MLPNELVQNLNLLRSSKDFVLHEDNLDGSMAVLSLRQVPARTGIYWISGLTKCKSGKELKSVFRVNSDDGGSLLGTFWWTGSEWLDQSDPQTLLRLSLTEDDVFPYDWMFSVPLEEDIYH